MKLITLEFRSYDYVFRRLIGELIVYQSSRRLKHHWGGGKAALSFGPDRIRTLVSMATNSSHRVIMGKML